MWHNIEYYKIATTKIHCKFKKALPTDQCYCSSKHLRNYRNFCVNKQKLTSKNFTYVIFESGFVNICGIKTLEETVESLFHLSKITKRTKNWKENFVNLNGNKKIIADNITVSGRLKSEIPIDFFILDSLIKKKFKSKYKTNFNCLHFPGLFLSIRGQQGKIVLFRNGKFNLLGLQCSQNIRNILKELDVFITLMWTMHTKE